MNDVSPSGEAATLFEVVGGRPFFDRLVDRFYSGAVRGRRGIRPLSSRA